MRSMSVKPILSMAHLMISKPSAGGSWDKVLLIHDLCVTLSVFDSQDPHKKAECGGTLL